MNQSQKETNVEANGNEQRQNKNEAIREIKQNK